MVQLRRRSTQAAKKKPLELSGDLGFRHLVWWPGTRDRRCCVGEMHRGPTVVCCERLGKWGGGGVVFSKLRVQIPVRCGPGFLARTVDSLRRWESKAEYHVNSGNLFP